MQKTIIEDVSAEIVQKKSKFIADLFYVQSEQEAEEKIKQIEKKYYDAKHHCFAYSVMTENGLLNRMSDDGEPSGTAGMPMLNILTKQELVNVLVVVTRYFGGILLGTGGLVKAYTDATLEAIEKSEFVKETRGYEVEVILEYQDFEKFQYFCKQNNITIIKVEYDEKIKCIIEATEEEKNMIIQLTEERKVKMEKYTILKQKNIRKNIEI